MTSEEFRTSPLLLRNQFERSGTFEIPVIHKEKVSLENLTLIGYDKISSGKESQVVHFFLDDYKFEVLWNNPEPRVERLAMFKAVLSPQFSIYRVCNDEKNYLGTDRYGKRWYAQFFA